MSHGCNQSVLKTKGDVRNTNTLMKFLILSISVCILLILDIVSKQWALSSNHAYPVAPGVQFVLVQNYGVAFGFMSMFGSLVQLASIALFITTAVYVISHGVFHRYPMMMWVFMIAGGLGNSLDRVVYGYVIDFIDIYYESAHWFVFNFADLYLTLAVLILFYQHSREHLSK